MNRVLIESTLLSVLKFHAAALESNRLLKKKQVIVDLVTFIFQLVLT